MKYFFSADTHFGHLGIIKHCNRPFKSVEEMDEALISNWNNAVKQEDQVIFLGDFAWKSPSKYIAKLNGNIVFVKGNHDKFSKIDCLDFVTEKGDEWFCCHNPEDSDALITIHGHVHNNYKYNKQKNGRKLINVGVDVWDFRPVDIKKIRGVLNNE